MPEEDRDLITEAATVIAGWTWLWPKLLAEHVIDSEGRCDGCFRNVHIRPRWPCTLASVAAIARDIYVRTTGHEYDPSSDASSTEQ